MLTTLSSKGQVVLPKPVRQALHLQPGTRFDIQVSGGTIILQPLAIGSLRTLYGRYAGIDFLADLEKEHREEIERDPTLRA